MESIDRRGRLLNQPFSYQVTKANKIRIFYEQREIMILSEKETAVFLPRIEGKSEQEIQLALAKVTGHFKHGNEREGKNA